MKSLSILFISLFFSCTTSTPKNPQESQPIESNIEEVKEEISETEKNTLLSNQTKFRFSDPNSEDHFNITLKGNSILEGIVYFQIMNAFGEEIYKETFPSYELIGYTFVGQEATDQEKEVFIKKRIAEFFAPDRFSDSTIAQNDKYDEDEADEEIWKEIQADSTSTGFSYEVGEENFSSIAWSKKRKKVVIYFSCC